MNWTDDVSDDDNDHGKYATTWGTTNEIVGNNKTI